MIRVHLDWETLGTRELSETGARKYMQDPEFRIILASFAFDDEQVHTLDMYHEPYPGYMLERHAPELLHALRSTTVGEYEIWAWNAPFEILGALHYLGITPTLENWRCSMVAAGYVGLPRKLGEAAKALNLDTLKDSEGTKLINLFTKPQRKPRKKYNFARWVTPEMARAEWVRFCSYNNTDVVVERNITRHTFKFKPMPPEEWRYWRVNEAINARGMRIDVPFVNACIDICEDYMTGINSEFAELTGGANPKSNPQVRAWALSRGVDIPSLAKDYLTDNVDMKLLPPDVARMLELRGAASKTSISKYYTMLNMLCDDGRIHDQIQFYGADTGRYAGRGVQPHNMTKTFSNENIIKSNAKRLGVPHSAIEYWVGNALETAKDAILSGAGALCYRDVTAIVGKLQRTAIIAAEGHVLIPCDYASIENKVLAWAAGEEWALDVHRKGGDIYVATAARMYSVPEDAVTGDMRDKGKRATLALGYQGWVGAMISSGAIRAGMTEDELPEVCRGWRNVNQKIVAFWRQVETAAKHVVSKRTMYRLRLPYCEIVFSFENGNMFITLPSGRRLCYHQAHVHGDAVRYMGMKTLKGTTTKIWGAIDLYGGLITENIIQAIARDCLAWAMDIMHHDGLPIVLHVHDEIVPEVPAEVAGQVLVYMEHLMSSTPLWANGLPLKAKGFITPFYCKE